MARSWPCTAKSTSNRVFTALSIPQFLGKTQLGGLCKVYEAPLVTGTLASDQPHPQCSSQVLCPQLTVSFLLIISKFGLHVASPVTGCNSLHPAISA